ncbi:MAG TPA: hypothetical protein VHX13_02970 [Acidobacteriaceae bacterium]|jgi:hypothetical protein|nr:hypothetical protein [Acidobacteriaceae bacterium]
MKIVRQSDSELVLRESTLWISILLALAALPLFYASTLPGNRGDLILAVFFAIGALVWLRKATVIFDAAQRAVRWRRMRFFRSASGTVPFSEIAGIGTETTSGSGGSTLYRLTILTGQQPIPFTDTFGAGRDRWTHIRDTAQRFLRTIPGTSLPAPGSDLDASLRSLLLRGRRVEAIRLLQTADHLDLSAATQRVNQLAVRIKAGK